MSDHVPTPWRVCDSHPLRAAIYIKPEDGWREIAALYGGFDDHEVQDENGAWQNDTIRMANAAFIVKAVNSHDQLVDALESFVGMFGAQQIPGTIGDEVLQKANAALASVTEST